MNVLDLFSGIGGFSLGLERAGMRTVAFCEIDPFCRKVLAKHWPNVPCYDDVTTLTADRLAADGIIEAVGNTAGAGFHASAQAGIHCSKEGARPRNEKPQRRGIDLICGGFPCQDISVAGKGAGIADGTRSGLWSEYARIIGELRPRYVIVENVAALLGRGLDRVLGDLAALGYDAEWHCIPASAVGAPHRRDRVWIVANADSYPRERLGQHMREILSDEEAIRLGAGRAFPPDADGERLEIRQGQDAEGARANFWPILERNEWWLTEPDVGRVADGVPARVDRLRSLGNAVVPQIPEIIGRAIMRAAE